jgi:pimeloyl-ACP methyl ester carboxylesterase
MPRPARQRATALVLASVLFGLLGACSSTSFPSSSSSPPPSGARAATGSLRWHACAAIECASLSVPLDANTPNGQHITLALARKPASGPRLGALLTNPGGPGASGVDFVRHADSVFSSTLRKNFDIVSWDPRGAGASAPVRCDINLDAFFAVDHSPDDTTEVQKNIDEAKALAASCARGSGDLLRHVSTLDSVRDMDAIRAALGEQRVTYLGFSYGTYLGAEYADRYPNRVRAMVLDGAVDPSLSYEQGTLTQAVGFEHALDAFLKACASTSQCGFATGGNPATALNDVLRSIDSESVPAMVAGEHRTLGPGEADLGVATALYAGTEGWPVLAQALSRAAQGDGSGLLRLSDVYTERQPGGHYSNEILAFYAISCTDTPSPRTAAEVQRLADSARSAAPHFGPSNFWLGLPCTYWPAPPTARAVPVHATGAPPIVVVGTSNDPATPLSGARALASQLSSGRLLIYEGEGHTAYGRGSGCIAATVDRYLVRLVPPKAGTRCD